MSSNDLVSGTAHYNIQPENPLLDGDGLLGLSGEANRPVSRRRDSTGRHVPPPISDNHSRHVLSDSTNDSSSTATGLNSTPPAGPNSTFAGPPYTYHIPQAPEFNISTCCDSPSSDEEEPTSPRTLADRYRREIEPPSFPSFDYDTSDENETEPRDFEQANAGPTPLARMARDARGMRNRRLAQPSRIESSILSDYSQRVNDKFFCFDRSEENRTRYPSLLTPQARFFIEKDKSMVTIKFDPPA